MYVCMYKYTHMYTHISNSVHAWIYIYIAHTMCKYIHIHTYIYIYMYIYVYCCLRWAVTSSSATHCGLFEELGNGFPESSGHSMPQS